ncbi:predicted protein [Histoplasma capsulatum var. duboisii H88]|uniref:Predicted protein n=1 Tax=Ajellomyces capsulatus (strain H88) TaxID=544711 RepID=F0U6X4_AJEC8|nr:predicted protein [Histoplasma capsulatum var. duboisii H88]
MIADRVGYIRSQNPEIIRVFSLLGQVSSTYRSPRDTMLGVFNRPFRRGSSASATKQTRPLLAGTSVSACDCRHWNNCHALSMYSRTSLRHIQARRIQAQPQPQLGAPSSVHQRPNSVNQPEPGKCFVTRPYNLN